tara:strand:- start:38 stop:304 length:267 start_codon:yes stop_codon:yes gene_type:complete
MIKNILTSLIFLFSMSFFYLIISTYFSDREQMDSKKDRKVISKIIENNISGLPVLINDTNNIIEFNSGFEDDNDKIKRSFWNLFKIND